MIGKYLKKKNLYIIEKSYKKNIKIFLNLRIKWDVIKLKCLKEMNRFLIKEDIRMIDKYIKNIVIFCSERGMNWFRS